MRRAGGLFVEKDMSARAESRVEPDPELGDHVRALARLLDEPTEPRRRRTADDREDPSGLEAQHDRLG